MSLARPNAPPDTVSAIIDRADDSRGDDMGSNVFATSRVRLAPGVTGG
jgi:hypothetical protein